MCSFPEKTSLGYASMLTHSDSERRQFALLFAFAKTGFWLILPIPSVFHPDPLQFHEPTHAVHGWQEHDDLAG